MKITIYCVWIGRGIKGDITCINTLCDSKFIENKISGGEWKNNLGDKSSKQWVS